MVDSSEASPTPNLGLGAHATGFARQRGLKLPGSNRHPFVVAPEEA